MRVVSLASFLTLLLLTLAWESWLAPKSHWLFGLSINTLPLVMLLPGLLQNRLRSFVIASLVLLLYLTEGIVLSWTKMAAGFGMRQTLPWALLETFLTLVFIIGASLHVRTARRQRIPL